MVDKVSLIFLSGGIGNMMENETSGLTSSVEMKTTVSGYDPSRRGGGGKRPKL